MSVNDSPEEAFTDTGFDEAGLRGAQETTRYSFQQDPYADGRE